jgi:hypothetical protein
MAYSPKVALAMAVQNTTIPEELEEAFKKQCLLVHPDGLENWQYETFMAECRRLIPVISVLKLRDRGLADVSRMQASIVRFLFTWPILLSDGLIEMEKQGDSLACLVLFHFFTAVARSDVESLWWARRRTRFVLERIRHEFKGFELEALDIFASPETPGMQCQTLT